MPAAKVKPRLIITADDYNIHPACDEAIEELVGLGVVTAVSALMHDAHAITNVRKLKERHPHVAVGLHLNVTTGCCALRNKVPALCEEGRNSYIPFTKLKYWGGQPGEADEQERQLVQLKAEVQEQYNRLVEALGPNEPVDHITAHHGVFYFDEAWFRHYLGFARQHGIPLRTPYRASKDIKLFTFMGIVWEGVGYGLRVIKANWGDVDELWNALSNKVGILEEMVPTTQYPDYYVDAFYEKGTFGRLKTIHRALARKARKVHKKNPAQPEYAELMVHASNEPEYDRLQEPSTCAPRDALFTAENPLFRPVHDPEIPGTPFGSYQAMPTAERLAYPMHQNMNMSYLGGRYKEYRTLKRRARWIKSHFTLVPGFRQMVTERSS